MQELKIVASPDSADVNKYISEHSKLKSGMNLWDITAWFSNQIPDKESTVDFKLLKTARVELTMPDGTDLVTLSGKRFPFKLLNISNGKLSVVGKDFVIIEIGSGLSSADLFRLSIAN